jgi:hypothetical protein
MTDAEKLVYARKLIRDLYDLLVSLSREADYHDYTQGAINANLRYCEEALGISPRRLLMEQNELKPLFIKEPL